MTMQVFEQFRRHLAEPGVGAEVLALDIARIGQHDLDGAIYLGEIDRLAEVVDRHLSPEAQGFAAASQFLEIITHDLGFHGNRTDYYDPRNSMLDQVLHRRTGLPIMLCLLCIAIGQRVDRQIEGMGFPHHFMARYTDAAGAWLLDPFYNAVVETEHAEVYLARIVGRPIQLGPHFFQPVGAMELAARILNNLRAAYMSHPDAERLRRVLTFQTILAPDQPQFWRERAVLSFHMQEWEEAAHDLRHYFFLLGALPFLFPEDVRAYYDLPELAPDDQNLLNMHHHIRTLLDRIN